MKGNSHLLYAVSVGSMVALNLDVVSETLPNIANTSEMATLFVLGGFIGGIFPDIDNPSSHMGKLTVPVSSVIGAWGKLTGKTGKNHRGLLHDATPYLLGLYFSYNCLPSLCGFLLGCFTHVFLDAFNPSGIPFLFGVKRIHLGHIVSGSRASEIFTWVNVGLALLVGIAVKTNFV